MKTTKTEMVEQEITEDVICNKCGNSCKKDHGFYGLIEHTVSGGYESEPLSDGTNYTFSLCEKCLDGLFDTFKVPVEITHYI